MRRLSRILTLPPVIGLIALLVVTGAIALLALFILPESAVWWAWAVVSALAALWAVLSLSWYWWRRRRNARMIAAIAPDPTGEVIAAEDGALEAKFAEGLKDLAKLRFRGRGGGSRYLYELPWYVFIGPPGAGKTEALSTLKSDGLDFALNSEGGLDHEGGGGTRNCNWIFTNDAVFIDTAGRYATRSSDEAVDAAAWKKFLGLLARHRPREPINGVIVAISLVDLATADPAATLAQAKAIRARIVEISDSMKAQVPVYVLITHADRLAGFNEFFQHLRTADRKQVWGTTFPLDDGMAADDALSAHLASIDTEYDALVDRLAEIQFRALQDEHDLGARALIFGFSAQFASMKSAVRDFLDQAFAPGLDTTPALLRGFYFTSATQVGQPVDRLIESLSRDFGIERQPIDTGSQGAGRAYFLSDLMTGVVFSESGLASRHRRKGISIGRAGALAACVALPIVAAGTLWTMHGHNDREAQALDEALGTYERSLAGVETQSIATPGLREIVPPLDILRAEARRMDGVEPPVAFGIGLDRTTDLQERAQGTYDAALERLLRPRLIRLFEDELRAALKAEKDLYPTLKAYLQIIGAKGSRIGTGVDREALRLRIEAALVDQPFSTAERRAMLGEGIGDGHVGALLAAGALGPWRGEDAPADLEPGRADLDISLVRATRARIDTRPEDKALDRLLASAASRDDLRDWSLEDAGVPYLDDAFVGPDGGPARDTVPALYTRAGFWRHYDVYSEDAVENALAEDWVRVGEAGSGKPDPDTILARLDALYYAEYIARWRGVLENLRIKPFEGTDEARAVLEALSAPTLSPLSKVVTAIATETALDAPVGSPLAKSMGGAVREEGMREVAVWLAREGLGGRIATKMLRSGAPGGTPVAAPGEAVTNAFRDLRAYVEQNRMDALLDDLKGFKDAVASPRAQAAPLRSLPEAQQVALVGAGAPGPVDTLIETMLNGADASSSMRTRARLNEIWRYEVYPVCVRKLEGRYPFGTSGEVRLGDLAEVLGPRGAITRFFDEHLRAYVDTGSWSFRPDGLALGLSPERLSFFRDAERLRSAFFEGADGRPSLEVRIRLRVGEGENTTARFALGGAEQVFTAADSGVRGVTWPGDDPAAGVVITVERQPRSLPRDEGAMALDATEAPPSAPVSATMRQAGTWGLLRIAEQIGIRPVDGGATRSGAARIGGQRVVVEMRFGSDENMLSLRSLMRDFTCPKTL